MVGILRVLKTLHTFFQRSKCGVACDSRNDNKVHWLLAPLQPFSLISVAFCIQGFH